MSTPVPIRIDFVSDVSCPWCAIGLASLEQAIARLGGAVKVDLVFQPFELNPQMGPDGQDIDQHIAQKYGIGPEQMTSNREAIRQRGAELGFQFGARNRIYNTFDAHRLLHWAGMLGRESQRALKHALLRTYFTAGEDVSSHDVLVRAADEVGLDPIRAREILASDEFADAVRERQRHYAGRGIRAVPSVILDDAQLIMGGQPVEVFEQALRKRAGIA